MTFTSNPFRSLEKRFAIAATPRVGTHLLCEKLRRHGGLVDEYFNPTRVVNECRRRNLATFEDFCLGILERFSVGGGFGVQGALHLLLPLIEAREFPRFAGQWRVVYLWRENLVRQAISHFIATRTDAWWSSRPARVALGEDDFDGRLIWGFMIAQAGMRADWEDAFAFYAIDPLRIRYEDLDADPQAVAAAVAEYLDLSGPPIGADHLKTQPPFERQANDLNARWEARFRDEGWLERPAPGRRGRR